MPRFRHEPVLLTETLQALGPKPGGAYVDATIGGGGHALHVLQESAPDGRLLAVDRDPSALAAARAALASFGERVRFVSSPFSRLASVVADAGFGRVVEGSRRVVGGIIADLGVSSPQLDRPERGFSFGADGPLDMRMSQEGETAAELIENASVEELARILAELGEVRGARRVAAAIKAESDEGRMRTTGDLAALCERTMRRDKRGHHPATRPFQALRIAVNAELEQLDALLAAAPQLVDVGGVVAIISFHSLEDRRVKRAFRALSSRPEIPRGLPVTGLGPEPHFELVGRGVAASDKEKQANPRARSARLRAIRRVSWGVDP